MIRAFAECDLHLKFFFFAFILPILVQIHPFLKEYSSKVKSCVLFYLFSLDFRIQVKLQKECVLRGFLLSFEGV